MNLIDSEREAQAFCAGFLDDGSKRSTASLRSTAALSGSVQNVLNGLNDSNDLN